MNVPVAVGVPVMVTTLAAQVPLTPAGRPVTFAPVAPVVLYVMLVSAVFAQRVCVVVAAAELSVIVFAGFTVTVPVAVAVPHPPVVVTV